MPAFSNQWTLYTFSILMEIRQHEKFHNNTETFPAFITQPGYPLYTPTLPIGWCNGTCDYTCQIRVTWPCRQSGIPLVPLSYYYKFAIQLSVVLHIWKTPLSLLRMQVEATFVSRRPVWEPQCSEGRKKLLPLEVFFVMNFIAY